LESDVKLQQFHRDKSEIERQLIQATASQATLKELVGQLEQAVEVKDQLITTLKA